jgi:hypothetical protein
MKSMPADGSNTEVLEAEREQTSGYVKEKIKAQNPKTSGSVTRAREEAGNLQIGRETHRTCSSLIVGPPFRFGLMA